MAPLDSFHRSRWDGTEFLTPQRLRQFMALNEWASRRNREVDETWVSPENASHRRVGVLLPFDRSFVDYERRLNEAIARIANFYGWSVPKLFDEVSAVNADLMRVRVDQSASDGTIALEQAERIIGSLVTMVRSAAITTVNPAGEGKGRAPRVVREFIEDDLRMAHTQQGSFVITVAARMERVNESSCADAREPEPTKKDDQIPDFSRLVMTTVAKSLQTTRDFAVKESPRRIEEARSAGMKLPFVKALHEMSEGDELRKLEIGFEWAAVEPQEPSVPSRIIIDDPVIRALPDIEKDLKKVTEPKATELIGHVVELKRGAEERGTADDDSGEIVLQTHADGRSRRVTVPLHNEDYDLAIRAHRDHLPFTVSGKMVKKRNAWWLDEPIRVERSYFDFLERR